MRRKVKVSRMADPDIKAVALVKSGANGQRFRVIKREGKEAMNSHMNLSDLNLFKKSERVQPVVAAILLSKKCDAATSTALKAQLEANGYTLDQPKDHDDFTAYYQVDKAELPDGKDVFIQMQDDLAALVRVDKTFTPDMDGTFSENVKQASLISGLSNSMDVLFSTIMRGLDEAESPDEAATKAENILQEFSSHVSGMIRNVPSKAFKLDPKALSVDEELREAVERATKAEAKGAESESESEPESKAASESAEKAGKKYPGKDKTKKQEAASEDVVEKSESETQDDIDEEHGALTEQLTQIQAALGQVTEAVTKMSQGLETVSERVGKVEESTQALGGRVEKAEKTLESTTGARSAEDDGVKAGARKDESEQTPPPFIDTGWLAYQ